MFCAMNHLESIRRRRRAEQYDHLFATIQSFRSRGLLASQGAEYWDYVVLDEANM